MNISASSSLHSLPLSAQQDVNGSGYFQRGIFRGPSPVSIPLNARNHDRWPRAKLHVSRGTDSPKPQAQPGSSVTAPFLKCVNAFRDSWVLAKDSEDLGMEFEAINQYLRGVGPESVKPKEVRRLIDEEGYSLVDVRIQWSYNEWHLEDAAHIPLQRVIAGNGLPKVWRKFGHALFVEFPAIESNFPNWLEEMTLRFSPDDKILIACDMGGFLDEEPSKCVSSSTFEAIYLLHHSGFQNLKYIKGGFCAWRNDENLIQETKGIRSDVPWYKTSPVLKEFFPAPCGWTHVKRCEQCGT